MIKKEKEMGKYFGTDGFRGEAGVTLTTDHAYKVGRFLGGYAKSRCKRRPRVVIGKDTRRSSYMLEYAIAAGLASSGADAYMLHVTTTPCVSYVTAGDGFDFGVMISASHNPFFDNGIKIVNSCGEKLDDDTTSKIDSYIDGDSDKMNFAVGAEVGEIVDYYSGRNRYIGFLISLSRHSFRGYKVGLDAANGGAWMIAKSVFDALGAETSVINAEPDGLNINLKAGSTHIEALVNHVKARKLDIGFAFDGDADRCIAVDEKGNVVNGDHILYILAGIMKQKGELENNTVVTTVMSNLGLYRALGAAGIRYEQTAVGDRFVYENMQKNNYSLGGEQSGHIILSKYATTGDGILTAIKLMETVIDSKTSLSELASPVKMLPQVTVNVKVADKMAVISNREVRATVLSVEKALGLSGRIMIRESGTEPVVRIMVEAESENACLEYCNLVAGVIKSEGLAK